MTMSSHNQNVKISFIDNLWYHFIWLTKAQLNGYFKTFSDRITFFQ
jgi:hypothetical protein